MRLYLSSFRLGDHPDRLVGLVGEHRDGWVIMNAVDGRDEERRRADLEQQVADLARLGLRGRELDLRDHTPDTISKAVGDPGFVWVRGGNVFTLRQAFARSGFDIVVIEGLAADRFVYAGYSAGPCVLGPDLHGLEHCDPVDDAVRLYGGARFDGLGVLDRPVVPHLDSPGHPETELLAEVAARHDRIGRSYWALRDGQVLIVDGDRVELV